MAGTSRDADRGGDRTGPQRSRGRRVLVLLLTVAGVVAALLLVALAAVRAAIGPPAWYAPPQMRDEAAASLAERVEYRLAEELQRVRPAPASWSIRLTDEQLNAWLALRLPAWWRREAGEPWPPELRPPQVRTRADGLAVAFAADVPLLRAGVEGELRPRSRGPGETAAGVADRGGGGRGDGPLASLGLEVATVRVGRGGGDPAALAEPIARGLGLAGGEAEQAMEAIRDPGAWLDAAIADALGSGAGETVLTLADGRRVRVTDIRLEEGAVVVSFAAPAGDGGGG